MKYLLVLSVLALASCGTTATLTVPGQTTTEDGVTITSPPSTITVTVPQASPTPAQ